MSQLIDERVVEMQFDNAQFEKAAKQTIGSLNGIHEEIDGLEDAAKSFNKTNLKLSSINTGALASALGDIKNSLKAIDVIGIAAITRLTNKVMALGEAMVKALTIDPLKTGLSEYEEKIDNIQTTLVNSGESIGTVNRILDELNHYADKTIYKFMDMTTALGKFTIAGIDLDEAKYAIEGIGNAAAMSGLKASQASSAYYMISQAYQSGVMTLYQFRTLENSGFASRAFREHIMDAAVKMGTLKKTAEGAYETLKGNEVTLENLRTTLDEKWLTKDVLQYTFLEYADTTTEFGKQAQDAAQEVKTATQLWDTLKEAAQSGWAKNWEYIIGDFYQAKELWTNINDVVSGVLNSMYDKQANDLKRWNLFGGRQATINGLANAFWSLAYALKPVKEAFREIFHMMTGERLIKLSQEFEDFTKKLQLSDFAFDSLKRTFKGIFALVDGTIKIIKQAATHIKEFLSRFDWIPQNILKTTAYIGDLLVQFDEFVSETDIFADSSSKLKTSFKDFRTGIGNLFNTISKNIDKYKGFSKIGYIIKETLFSSLDGIQYIFKNLFGVDISAGIEKIKKEIQSFADTMKPIIDYISDFFPELNELFRFDNLNWEALTFGEKFAKILGAISNVAFSVASGIFRIGNAITKGIVGALTDLKLSEIIRYITSGALVSAIASLIAQISNLLDPLADFGDMINNIREDFAIKMAGRQANALKNLGIAIAIVAGSLYLISKIDPTGFQQGLTGIALIVTVLLMAQTAMKGLANSLKTSNPAKDLFGIVESISKRFNMTSIAIAIVSFASSIGILALSLKKIAEIDDINKLLIAFGAIEGFLATLTGIMWVMTKFDSKDTVKGFFENLLGAKMSGSINAQISNISSLGNALLKMSISIAVLTIPIKKLGEMPFGQLLQGGLAVIALITAFGVFGKLTEKMDLKSASQSLLGFSASVGIIVLAIDKLSKIENAPLLDAILALGSLFAAFYAFAFFSQNIANLKESAASLLAYSASLLIMSIAIKQLSKVNNALNALTASSILGILMLIFAAISQAVNPVRAQAVATSLLIFSSSLLVMALPLRMLSSLGSTVMNGVIAITTLLAEMAILSYGVNPAAMASVAGALITFGIAVSILSVDLLMLSAIPFGDALGGLILLAGAIAAIAFAGPALVGLSPAITAVGGALIVFGIGAGLVSGAIFLLVAAFYLLVEALSKVSEHTELFGASFVTLLATILRSDVIKDLGKTFTDSFVGTIIKEFGSKLLMNALKGSMYYWVVWAMSAVVKDISGTIYDMMRPLFEMVLKAVDFVTGSDLADKLPSHMFEEDAKKTTKSIKTQTEEAEEAYTELLGEIEKSSDETSSALDNLLGKFKDIWSGNGSTEDKLKSSSSIFTEVSDNLKEKVLGASSGVASSLKEESKGLSEELESVAKNATTLGDEADNAKTSIDSVTDSIKQQTNAFKKFDKTVDITAQDLQDNLASNVTGMHEWASNLSRLAKRGLNAEVLQKLVDEGLGSYKEVSAFSTMTDEQIKEYNDTYTLLKNAMTLTANQTVDSLKYSSEVAAKGFSNALDNYWGAVDAEGMAVSSLEDVAAAVKLNTDLVTAAEEKAKQVVDAVNNVLTDPTLRHIGYNAMEGLREGIEADENRVYMGLSRFADKAIKTVMVGWDEHSPSKEFAKVGEYAMLGLLNGIEGTEDKPVNAIAVLTSKTLTAMQNAVDAIENDSEFSPVITPILDLSNIQNGANSMNGMLSREQAVMASMSYQINARAAYEEETAYRLNNLQESIDNLGASIVNAIVESSDKDVNLSVSVTPDSAGLFKMVRVENTKFRRANGYNALA